MPDTLTGLFSPTVAVDIHAILGAALSTVTVVVSVSLTPAALVTRRPTVKTPS